MTRKTTVLILLFLAVPVVAETTTVQSVRKWRTANEARIITELAELLSLPNVASDAVNIDRNVTELQSMLEHRGFAVERLEVTGSPPAVFGERKAADATRTLVFYAHYDGQPVVPEEWASDPWTPTLLDAPRDKGGRPLDLARLTSPVPPESRLYARSSSDDKAPIVAFLSAIDALAAGGVPIRTNIKIFLEGEEENGSPHLETMLRTHAEKLKGDLWIFGDGPVHQSRAMQIYYGVRGVTTMELTTYGPSRALHSGHYGNWAPNPIVTMISVLASMRDTEGRILIDDFHDDVRPLTGAEKEALARIPSSDAQMRDELALGRSEGAGQSLAERITIPAMNIRGISGGAVGERSANAIPTHATASLDFRLVPDQTPERVITLVRGHLLKQGFHVVTDEPTRDELRKHPKVIRMRASGDGYPSARTDMALPIVGEAAEAVRRARPNLIEMPTLGGSLPIFLFQKVLGAPLIGVPIVNHDNSQHAADENVRIQNLWDGIEVYAAILAEM